MKKIFLVLFLSPILVSAQQYIRTQHGSQIWLVNANGLDSTLLPAYDLTGIMYKPLVTTTVQDSSKFQTTMGIGTRATTSPLTVANFSTSFVAPQAGTMIHIVSDNSVNGRISHDTYNNTSFTGSIIQGRRARGTAAVPLPVILDDIIMSMGGDVYGTSSFTGSSIGSFNIRAAGTSTNTSKPTYLSGTVTAVGSTTQREVFKFNSTGTLKLSAYGTNGFLRTNASDSTLTTSALTGAEVTTALGYTPGTGNGTLTAADTVSLSNRINTKQVAGSYATTAQNALKVNYTDTAAMLSAYQTGINGKASTASVALKLNISDTAAMLTNYQPKLSASTNLQSISAGTGYTLTATSAKAIFGTTSPSITISVAGTYLINYNVFTDYSAATLAASRAISYKVRRTTNTAADLDLMPAINTPIITLLTFSAPMVNNSFIYIATAGDVLEVWGSISVIPTAGAVKTNYVSINATKLY